MYKAMIVDDEAQIRKGLRFKVDWEEQGFVISEEASDGTEALRKLKSARIDLLITDIRMPIMDGLELVKICRKEYPQMKVAVLSGYSDFEYARMAMKEGVKDYLLKPVSVNELTDLLYKMRREIESEQQQLLEYERVRTQYQNQLEQLQEQFLLLLAKEEWPEYSLAVNRLRHLQLDDLALPDVSIQFISVEIRASGKRGLELSQLRLPFRMLCREIAKESGAYAFFDPSYQNMMQFLVCSSSLEPIRTAEVVRKIQKYVKAYIKVEIVIGIGKPCKGLAEFKNGYVSSLLSWSHSKLGPQSQIIENTMNEEMPDFSPEVEKKIIISIENLDPDMFQANLKSLLLQDRSQSVISFVFLTSRILFLLCSVAQKYDADTSDIQSFLWQNQQGVWEWNTPSKALQSLTEMARDVMKEVQKMRMSNGSHIVEGVRCYLEKNYAYDISLATLSKQFHINGAYLSEIFKQHVGETFSDYLMRLRLNKARDLLREPYMKITDIALLCGFSNPSYFSTVFKKHFGQTPIEFRKGRMLHDSGE